MKIKVWKAYTGNRAKKTIKEGIYDDSDRRLYGLSRYLIDNGNAVEVAIPIELLPDNGSVSVSVTDGVAEVIQIPIAEALEAVQPKKRKTRSDKGKPREQEV